MRIDAHTHLWDLTVREQAWTDDLPTLRRSFAVSELTSLLLEHRFDGAVLVQTVNDRMETEEFLALAETTWSIAGVVGWLELTAADLGEQIATLRAGRGGASLVGLRHQVQDERDPAWLTRPDVIRGLAATAEAGLAFDLVVVPEQWDAVLATVRWLPEVRFVLDHAAKPRVPADTDRWHVFIRELAELPNVAAKLSGLGTQVAQPGYPSDLRPVGLSLLKCFGADRVMFGSDWPVTLLAGSYRDGLEWAEEVTGSLSATEHSAVFGGSAASWYGLTP